MSVCRADLHHFPAPTQDSVAISSPVEYISAALAMRFAGIKLSHNRKLGDYSKKADAQPELGSGRTVSDGPKCGIVMPISAIDNCDERHWAEVLEILEDSASGAGFVPSLVSNADDVGVIHKRIIQNLYDNPIVLCDVSCKNPNVMFELGLRLAFDKPTIIIKDDKTAYSFDTAAIEHLEYPRDLRFSQTTSPQPSGRLDRVTARA